MAIRRIISIRMMHMKTVSTTTDITVLAATIMPDIITEIIMITITGTTTIMTITATTITHIITDVTMEIVHQGWSSITQIQDTIAVIQDAGTSAKK